MGSHYTSTEDNGIREAEARFAFKVSDTVISTLGLDVSIEAM